MTEPCSDLIAFADGELDDARADAFRAHLATCEACQIGLVEAMQLSARLSTLPPQLRVVRGADEAADAAAEVAEAAPPVRAPAVPPIAHTSRPLSDDSSVSSGRGQIGHPQIPQRKQRPVPARSKWWAGGALAAVASLIVLFAIPPKPAPPVVSALRSDPFETLTDRPFEVRLAYPGASHHRPFSAPIRGSGNALHDEIPPDQLAALEHRHELHGRWIAELWNHRDLRDIATKLRKLESTPALRSDVVAVESLTTDENNIDPLLRELESLQQDRDVSVARAAKWNYALQLARLELPVSAAARFTEIANDREPGWAEEAAGRARAAQSVATKAEQAWHRGVREGDALLAMGTPVSEESLSITPGLMRAYLYNAVRTAPSAERVRALAPMAAALDQHGDRPILTDYVQRVAGLGFQQRAPLARLYARALAHQALTPAEQRSLTTPTPAPDVADIVMGGMIELDAVPTHLAAFGAMAKAANDPWFDIVLARAAADVAARRGDWIGAVDVLRKADRACTEISVYQCLALETQLGEIYEKLHRVPAALQVVQAALRSARRWSEWGRYRQLLFLLADLERFNASTAAARAYAQEALLLAGGDPSCAQQAAAHQVIAGAAVLDVNGPAARDALKAAVDCRPADLGAATALSDIGRLDPQPDDLPKLRTWLEALRQGTTLTQGQRVMASAIEGRLQIEHDRAGGAQLLEQAIKEADALPEDVDADKARAAAYSALQFTAARNRDYAATFDLVARSLGLATPNTCAVAMGAEDERSVIVIRGAAGEYDASYNVADRPRTDPLLVPEALTAKLTGCMHVQVMALAALQGQPHVLPSNLAWSYATDAHRRSPPPRAAAARPRILMVTNVVPPADLQLPALMTVQLDSDPSIRNLSGREATPTRVLAEMQDATEIQFHTHALVDVGISDASHLVLSPDADGHYALTAESIRSTRLRGHPIVVLAACQSAQGAHYQHAAWSLPDAFIAAGARAVFAAGTNIPDLEAGPVFDRVLANVRGGADPATALREERMHSGANTPSWVGDVMLFE